MKMFRTFHHRSSIFQLWSHSYPPYMSAVSSIDDGRDSKRQKVAPHRYQISTPDNPHQFVDNWFTIIVFVMNESGQLTSGGGERFVEVVLGVSGNTVNDEEEEDRYMPDLFEVDTPDPSAIRILNGRATIRVKILECSMNDATRRFFIEARQPASTESVYETISPARTKQIVVINHQLQLSEGLVTWEDEWYKDEGGREKCITFGVELRNAKGDLVERKVPLKIRLVYANGNEVERQDILKLLTECETTCNRGHAEIKARIDEVSRSHQNQSFQIKVSPDASLNPMNNDVSSVLSPHVVVRSKRNNRKKVVQPAVVGPTVPLRHLQPLASLSVPSGGGSPIFRQPSDDETAAATLMAVRAFTPRDPNPTKTNEREEPISAVGSVTEWVETVVHTMNSMRWKEEYDRLPDGSLDTMRPRYSIRNPNQDIDRLLSMYKSRISDSLQSLELLESSQQKKQEVDQSDHSTDSNSISISDERP